MSIVVGWWIVPAAITVAALLWAGWAAHKDRGWLLAEVERLTRERDEARKESDRLYTECGQLWDEYKKMCETIRTIGARCVELDDREAVSAILDIVEKVLEEDMP